MFGLSHIDAWSRNFLFGAAPERSFRQDLDRQCRRVLIPCAVLCVTAWLPYVWLDRAIYPERPVLPVLRLSLSAVALLVLVTARWPGQPVRPSVLAALLLGWLQIAGAAITGLTGADPIYVGGFILLLLAGPVVPLPRATSWGLLAASAATLLATGAWSGLAWASARQRYTVNDLGTAALVSALFIYVTDSVRRETWQLASSSRAQAAELLRDAQRIAELERLLLGPVEAGSAGQVPAGTKVSWQSASVLAIEAAGQVDIARALVAHTLAAESTAWARAMDDAATAQGAVAAVGLNGARLYLIAEATADGPVSVAVLSAVQEAAAAHDAAMLARALPQWRCKTGVANGPLVVARVAEQVVAYDLWTDTVARARAAAAHAPPASAVVTVDGATAERPRLPELHLRQTRQSPT